MGDRASANEIARYDDECPICMEPFSAARARICFGPCGHGYCRGCIDRHQEFKIDRDEAVECPTCRGPMDQSLRRQGTHSDARKLAAMIFKLGHSDRTTRRVHALQLAAFLTHCSPRRLDKASEMGAADVLAQEIWLAPNDDALAALGLAATRLLAGGGDVGGRRDRAASVGLMIALADGLRRARDDVTIRCLALSTSAILEGEGRLRARRMLAADHGVSGGIAVALQHAQSEETRMILAWAAKFLVSSLSAREGLDADLPSVDGAEHPRGLARSAFHAVLAWLHSAPVRLAMNSATVAAFAEFGARGEPGDTGLSKHALALAVVFGFARNDLYNDSLLFTLFMFTKAPLFMWLTEGGGERAHLLRQWWRPLTPLLALTSLRYRNSGGMYEAIKWAGVGAFVTDILRGVGERTFRAFGSGQAYQRDDAARRQLGQALASALREAQSDQARTALALAIAGLLGQGGDEGRRRDELWRAGAGEALAVALRAAGTETAVAAIGSAVAALLSNGGEAGARRDGAMGLAGLLGDVLRGAESETVRCYVACAARALVGNGGNAAFRRTVAAWALAAPVCEALSDTTCDETRVILAETLQALLAPGGGTVLEGERRDAVAAAGGVDALVEALREAGPGRVRRALACAAGNLMREGGAMEQRHVSAMTASRGAPRTSLLHVLDMTRAVAEHEGDTETANTAAWAVWMTRGRPLLRGRQPWERSRWKGALAGAAVAVTAVLPHLRV
ncbi:unnamed protein product [Pedinophyceae sp. YPF-701]|nr:unnamed protein product [Pedinophyceae sp. YPF-701]